MDSKTDKMIQEINEITLKELSKSLAKPNPFYTQLKGSAG
jgi:hypothetical protein